jgi:hypothetical protein
MRPLRSLVAGRIPTSQSQSSIGSLVRVRALFHSLRRRLAPVADLIHVLELGQRDRA